jgi:hypothetical protein
MPVQCSALTGLNMSDDCSGVVPGAIHRDLLAQLSAGAVPLERVVDLHGFRWHPPSPVGATSQGHQAASSQQQQQAHHQQQGLQHSAQAS